MTSNDGSIESMEKSAFEENHSFDMYEAHNPALINDYLTHASTLPSHATTSTANQHHFIATTPTSSFQSYENIPSSNIEDSTTITFNSEMFPLNTFTPTYSNSNSNSVSEFQISPGSRSNGTNYRPNYTVQEIRSKFPSKRRLKPIEIRNLPTPPTPPQLKFKTVVAPVINRPKSANLLDNGNFEERLRLSPKAKSEAVLETNLDFEPECSLLHSKSQPLETAM